jgi:hypothetical protein
VEGRPRTRSPFYSAREKGRRPLSALKQAARDQVLPGATRIIPRSA